MTTSGLPKGFVYGNKVKPDGKKWEPESPDAFEKRRRRPVMGPPQIDALQDAIQVFRARMDVTKLDDVVLGGLRVGVLFRQLSTGERYLLLFKRAPYYQFSNHFPLAPNGGYGMICNLKLVHWAALEDITIAAMMPDGKTYAIVAKEFYDYYEENETEVPHMDGEIATPFKMWRRLC